jgi:hypothetical protein
MVACSHEAFDQPQHPQPPKVKRKGEHPVIAIVAVFAMIAAMLLITWARVEVHGTGDLEAAFTEGAPLDMLPDRQRELDAAVTSNRFAAGVSPQ